MAECTDALRRALPYDDLLGGGTYLEGMPGAFSGMGSRGGDSGSGRGYPSALRTKAGDSSSAGIRGGSRRSSPIRPSV